MASSDDFVALVRADGPVPGSFQVLGERNSGTNFVKATMKRNLRLDVSEALGWKHGFPQMLAVPRGMLVVAVVREPFAWSRSMHAKPWHAPAEIQRLGYSDFIRARWDSVVDRRRYFGLAPGDERLGMPLQPDRHPLTGAAFGNIFEMRNAKFAALLGIRARGSHFAMLRLEAFQADPEGMLDVLAGAFGIAAPDTFRPVRRRLGARFAPAVEPRPETPDRISGPDRAFILSALDRAQETQLGYARG